MTFDAKFAFTAGNTTFPAGSYEIRPPENDTAVVQVASRAANGPSAFVDVTGAQPKTKLSVSDVVFQRYGDKYLLKTVWDVSSGSGVTLVATHGEKAYAKAGTPTERRVSATPKSKN